MSINNEVYNLSLIPSLIQDLQQSEDKSQDTLKCILHSYGVTISETFTVQDFIKKCGEIPGVDQKSLAIFELFVIDTTENQDAIQPIVSPEQAQEGASENAKIFLQSRHNEVTVARKINIDDFEKILSWQGLDYYKKESLDIFNIPGFGFIHPSAPIETAHLNDDTDLERVINNTQYNYNVKYFTDLTGFKIIGLDRGIQLLNTIAKQIGIMNIIDENYIYNEAMKYGDKELPGEHPLHRILLVLLYMMKYGFVLIISLKNKKICSLRCNKARLKIEYFDSSLIDNYWPHHLCVKENVLI